ncbi:HD domain-containing protein [Tabrizicola oligotrophica]|uniref:HD domain-containing protein n=1 Tax=Tabrizicola oligotrophica TaxID=2710650 RepID=A0A6M0QTH3_9RHOB|nr:HD domain-containing protein [Tabrizicola oligotrophica]NEY90134.1 HD domain-containing protein [Tabrizicola oligotrophica]
MTALLRPQDEVLWHEARPFLDVRNNDEHTLVAYGVARALLAALPEAEADVVLPAILLHDVGWKRIPPDLLLAAIGRNPTRRDLVFEHERHSVVIAREILTRHGLGRVDEILAIIDGHDTTTEARSLNDAVMKDADKGWRTTPHGMRIIRGWYDWSLADYIDMVTVVSNPRLLTAPGKAMAEGFTASLRAERQLTRYMETGA